MDKVVSVLYDGEVFRPQKPLNLEPNTLYDITLEATPSLKSDSLEKLYTIEDKEQVAAFLQQNPMLGEFLQTASIEISKYFPQARLSVKIAQIYAASEGSRLIISIYGQGEKVATLIKFNQLKANWWLDTAESLNGKATIYLEHPEISTEKTALAFTQLAGTVDAPEDWSLEHDHYIHGTPKRH